MVRRNITRRLQRMEERVAVSDEAVFHVIQFVDGDGTVSGELLIQHGGVQTSAAPQGASGDGRNPQRVRLSADDGR